MIRMNIRNRGLDLALLMGAMYSFPTHNGPNWKPVNRLRDRVRNDLARMEKAELKRAWKNHARHYDYVYSQERYYFARGR